MSIEENQGDLGGEIVENDAVVIDPNDVPDDVTIEEGTVVDERDYEAEAKEMGWVPEKDFRGPEGKWKDAKAFVEDGENVLPIVRSQNKRLREEIQKEREEIQKERDDFAKRLAAIERTSKAALDRQKAAHEAAMSKLAKDMRKAAADGDIEMYDELSSQRDQLSKEAPKEPEIEEETGGKSVDDEFMERNDWYNVDDDLTVYAQGYSQRLIGQNPNMSRSEMFAKVEAKVKEMFPQKFGASEGKRQPRNGHAAVDGGSDAPATPGSKGNLAAKLPAEARAAGQGFVKDGLFKNLEEYAKEYFNG